MEYQETIIVSLGGSMVVPDGINISFLQLFSELIQRHVGEGKRFCIIVGGGKPARQYQQALKELKTVTPDELDWDRYCCYAL
jgi:uridylate kinase